MRYSLGILSIVVLCNLGCSSKTPKIPILPKANEVEKVEVRIAWPYDENDVPQKFTLPSEQIEATFRLFENPVYEELPPEKFLVEVASLRVVCEDTTVIDLRVVFFGKEPARFMINGIPCMRDGPYKPVDFFEAGDGLEGEYVAESLTIYAYLKAVHEGKEKEAKELLETFAKSAGRIQ